jgi:hypothetical protein
MFLKLVDGKVVCTDEGMTLPEVQYVFKRDKTVSGKSYFHDVITAIYYLYRPRGIYWNLSMKDRIENVNRDHIATKDSTWEALIKKEGVKAMADKYISLMWTINDRLEDALKNDADELMNMLADVPMSVKELIKVDAKVICEEGIERTVTVKKEIIIPNLKGKKELWDMAQTLSKQLKEVQGNLKIEEEERIKESLTDRRFDSIAGTTIVNKE